MAVIRQLVVLQGWSFMRGSTVLVDGCEVPWRIEVDNKHLG